MSSPILEVRGITKRFAGLVANDDVSFSVNEGEIVSIIGPNGAGKSTLFACITGFQAPSAGTVTWRGRDITGFKADRVCRLGIARTFQIVQVIGDMTVLENVMTGAFLHAPARKRGPPARRGGAGRHRAGRQAGASWGRRSPSPTRSGSRWPWRWPPSPACSCSTSRWPD